MAKERRFKNAREWRCRDDELSKQWYKRADRMLLKLIHDGFDKKELVGKVFRLTECEPCYYMVMREKPLWVAWVPHPLSNYVSRTDIMKLTREDVENLVDIEDKLRYF